MKRLLYLIVGMMMCLPALAANKQLKSFEELLKVLEKGKEVSVVLHYGDCVLEYDGEIQDESVDAIGGMKIDVFEYFAPGSIRNEHAFLVASTSKLIKNPLGEGYVYNYVKIKVDENDQVVVTAEYIDPLTYEAVMHEKFYGEINNGKNQGCVYFYKRK